MIRAPRTVLAAASLCLCVIAGAAPPSSEPWPPKRRTAAATSPVRLWVSFTDKDLHSPAQRDTVKFASGKWNALVVGQAERVNDDGDIVPDGISIRYEETEAP